MSSITDHGPVQASVLGFEEGRHTVHGKEAIKNRITRGSRGFTETFGYLSLENLVVLRDDLTKAPASRTSTANLCECGAVVR